MIRSSGDAGADCDGESAPRGRGALLQDGSGWIGRCGVRRARVADAPGSAGVPHGRYFAENEKIGAGRGTDFEPGVGVLVEDRVVDSIRGGARRKYASPSRTGSGVAREKVRRKERSKIDGAGAWYIRFSPRGL